MLRNFKDSFSFHSMVNWASRQAQENGSSWTRSGPRDLGAKYVGIFHSLFMTCKLHDIDPFVYLVDVLQRIDTHPASEIEKLPPRFWKAHFSHDPIPCRLKSFRKLEQQELQKAA